MYLAEYEAGRPVEQLSRLLSNPIRYIQMLFYSINVNSSKYLLSMFGGEVGLNEHVILHTFVPYVFMVVSLMAGILNEEIKDKFSKFQTIIIALIVLAVVGLIFTSLYIQWTGTTEVAIKGVQGRYFLPILPLVLLLLRKIKNTYSI